LAFLNRQLNIGSRCPQGLDREEGCTPEKIKDDIKAVRIEATKAYMTYVEEPKTSQRR